MASTLSTGALCEAAGITRGALRLYERAGLVKPPRRNAAGYRLFAADTLERLAEIRAAKEVGFTLAEIRELMTLIEARRATRPRVKALVAEKLAGVRMRIERLERLRDLLLAVQADPDVLSDPNCDLLERFTENRR